MFQNLFSILFSVLYYFGLIYFVFIEISYFYFKHLKKDLRFNNIGFFKYFESPVKTLRGDK